MPTAEPRQTITTIERAADVLTLFAQRERADLGVTEIATALHLSKAVVHRVLTTLAAKGFVSVDADTRRYRLGPAVLALGVAYLDRIDLHRLAMPKLRELSTQTNETATLSMRFGWTRIYIDQITPPREVRMSVALGRPFPLHAGSSSKAFLAFLPEDEQERYITDSDLESLTNRTITDPRKLRSELKRVRDQGYAVSLGERQAGAGSVAAPVFDHRAAPAGVVSVCGPIERFADEVEMASKLLLAATGDLSHHLGHQTTPTS